LPDFKAARSFERLPSGTASASIFRALFIGPCADVFVVATIPILLCSKSQSIGTGPAVATNNLAPASKNAPAMVLTRTPFDRANVTSAVFASPTWIPESTRFLICVVEAGAGPGQAFG